MMLLQLAGTSRCAPYMRKAATDGQHHRICDHRRLLTYNMQHNCNQPSVPESIANTTTPRNQTTHNTQAHAAHPAQLYTMYLGVALNFW